MIIPGKNVGMMHQSGTFPSISCAFGCLLRNVFGSLNPFRRSTQMFGYVWIIGIAAGVLSTPITKAIQKKKYNSLVEKSGNEK